MAALALTIHGPPSIRRAPSAGPLATTPLHPSQELGATVIDEVTLELVLLQLIPFLLTVFGLQLLIFKPMLAHLADRERNIDGFKRAAELMQEEVRGKVAELDARLVEARVVSQAERARLRAEAKIAEAKLIATARRQTEKLVTDARAALEIEKQAARAQVESSARALSGAIASQVLGRTIEGGA